MRINKQLAESIVLSSPCHCLNVRRAALSVSKFYDKLLVESGLRYVQYSLLRYIELSGTITITELAERMRINRTTLSRNLQPLQHAGLIKIQPGKDSRFREVRLTDKGKISVVCANTMWEQAQKLMETYLQEELPGFEKVLLKLELLAV